MTATGTAPVHVTSNKYPDPPPASFRLNPDCESMLQRYCGYLARHEHLPSMAYFCLTLIESNAGHRRQRVITKKRRAAATRYGIDVDVLATIGELSSTRGDPRTARKANATQPLSGAESAWLEAAVKMLIQRIGDTRAGTQLPLITMSHLPRL
jgi:hypothetical protein